MFTTHPLFLVWYMHSNGLSPSWGSLAAHRSNPSEGLWSFCPQLWLSCNHAPPSVSARYSRAFVAPTPTVQSSLTLSVLILKFSVRPLDCLKFTRACQPSQSTCYWYQSTVRLQPPRLSTALWPFYLQNLWERRSAQIPPWSSSVAWRSFEELTASEHQK